jgi:hypothetical protein
MAVGIEPGTTNAVIAAGEAGKADRHTEHRRIAEAPFGGAFTAT